MLGWHQLHVMYRDGFCFGLPLIPICGSPHVFDAQHAVLITFTTHSHTIPLSHVWECLRVESQVFKNEKG